MNASRNLITALAIALGAVACNAPPPSEVCSTLGKKGEPCVSMMQKLSREEPALYNTFSRCVTGSDPGVADHCLTPPVKKALGIEEGTDKGAAPGAAADAAP